METGGKIKSLFILVNAGFANDIIEIARDVGAKGATIINARGGSTAQVMGISVDEEKEIILCIVEEEEAENIMAAVKEKAGYKSPAHSFCFTVPVERLVGINVLPT